MNLILQKKPYARLWLTSTIESDNKENIYKKDIILYPNMKVAAKDKEMFEIICPVSKKKYQFITSVADQWVKELRAILIEKNHYVENQDEFLD